MGSIAPQQIVSAQNLDTSFADVGELLDVGGQDRVTFLIEVDGNTDTELTLRVLHGTFPFFRVNGTTGATEAEEITHDLSVSRSFAVRLDTEAIKSLQLQAKGDAGTDNISVQIVRSGTDNKSPTNLQA